MVDLTVSCFSFFYREKKKFASRDELLSGLIDCLVELNSTFLWFCLLSSLRWP